MTTFVTVGNLNRPFTRLLDGVRDVADMLTKPIVVQHGPARFDDPRCVCVEKLSAAEYRATLEAASLVICHAGQGSLLEAAALRKPIVTVPRLARHGEHIDDHQIEFAEYFVERGWAVIPRDGETLAEAAARAVVPVEVPVLGFDALAETVSRFVRREAGELGLDDGA
jgi:UDP-N-acetylglucosamine transferase subunit ALG13